MTSGTTSKERVITTLGHLEPDRVPVGEMGIDYPIIEQVLGHPTFYRAQGKERKAIWEGRRDDVVRSQKEDLVALVHALDWDIVPVWLTYSSEGDYRPTSFLSADKLKWQDAEGNIWQATDDAGDALCIQSRPFTPDVLEEMLTTPPVVHDSQLEFVRYVIQELGDTHFVIARGWHGPSTWLDGSFPTPGEGLSIPIHRFLMMIYDDPQNLHAILQAYTKRAIEYGKILIAAGVDAVQLNADYCFNTGPWLSPAHFEEHILPYMQQLVTAFRQEGVFVLKHTDGQTWRLLDMMVQTGIDALHGIQPSAGMDMKRLKERVGGQVALFGAVEGDTLINGTPKEVAGEVEYCLRYGAPGGGYVLTTSNSVQVGTDYENYMTMLRVAREKGTYPINL